MKIAKYVKRGKSKRESLNEKQEVQAKEYIGLTHTQGENKAFEHDFKCRVVKNDGIEFPLDDTSNADERLNFVLEKSIIVDCWIG